MTSTRYLSLTQTHIDVTMTIARRVKLVFTMSHKNILRLSGRSLDNRPFKKPIIA